MPNHHHNTLTKRSNQNGGAPLIMDNVIEPKVVKVFASMENNSNIVNGGEVRQHEPLKNIGNQNVSHINR